MAVRLLLPFPPRGARATERPAQTSSLWALDRRGRRAGVCCLWDPLHTWWGLRAAGWGPGLARRPFPPFQLPPPPATLPPPPAKPQPRWRKGSGGGPHCQAEPGSPGAHTPRATARRHRPPVGGACGRSAQGLNLGPGSGCGSLGRRGAGVRTAWAGGWLRACVCAPGGAHKDIRLLPRPSASLTATTRIRGSRAGSSPARSALRGLPQGFPGSGSESSGRMILLGLQCAPCWQEEPSGRPGICTPVLLPWARCPGASGWGSTSVPAAQLLGLCQKARAREFRTGQRRRQRSPGCFWPRPRPSSLPPWLLLLLGRAGLALTQEPSVHTCGGLLGL